MSSARGLYRRVWEGRFERQWTGIALTAASIPPGPIDTSRDGLANNPACANCHVNPVYGIDALAKFADCWKADGTFDGACTLPDAMFLTQAGKGLPALGQLMVGTKEWKAQVVSFYFRMFFGRGLATSEANYYLDAAKTFETSGFRAKALILDPGRPTGSLGETGTLPPEEGGPSVPPGEISGLYQQMFLEAPSATETTRASGLLAAAFADGADPKEAWRALCVWATSRR